MTVSLTHSDENALKALIAWWDEAGVPLDMPVTRPRAALARTPAGSQGGAASRTEPRGSEMASSQAAARTATAATARAAGFGTAPGGSAEAQRLAGTATSLEALREAIEHFEGCALKRTARTTVFARGNPAARIMVIGEAPGKEEDEQGRPFVGPAGHLLDRMFAAIGLGPEDIYASNVLNWRPPGNRAPTRDEIAQCLPFIERHIALAEPEFLVFAGGVAAQSLLRSDTGIARLRGNWTDYARRDSAGAATADTLPVLPMFHPAYLIRRPADKRKAWLDLQALQERLAAPGLGDC